jgi:3-oxoacyl-[acyl-carrier-protein] synthase II
MMRRVVVTGIGVVTPLGRELAEFWQNLVGGASAVRQISLFDASNFPVRIAAQVPDSVFNCSKPFGDRRNFKVMNRATKFAVAASDDAVRDAGLSAGEVAPEHLGVVVGSGFAEGDFARQCRIAIRSAGSDGEVDLARYAHECSARQDPLAYIRRLPNMPACHVAIRHGARGPNSSIMTACAAGTHAIGQAARIIERGDAKVVLAGGADARIHPDGIMRFALLGTLSGRNDAPTEASRPFDADRDGFVIGEGAAMFVLESWDHAFSRGARPYAEVVGFGSTADAWGLVAAPEDVRGAVECLHRALADARLEPNEIDYIAAHGTSTPTNDRLETLAIKKVFGRSASAVAVSSIKSMIGHLIAAAGAVQFAACLLALRTGMVPPTINHQRSDPACDLDYVPNHARTLRPRAVMSNSFGFGGQNASLIAVGV